MNTITLTQATKLLPACLNAGIVPFLHSSPAIGKSSIAKQLAHQAKLKVIDLRLTELDSSDLNGLPYFKDGKSSFLPFDTFPLTDTPIPEGYQGWLLLLDEINSAAPSTQAAAYKLILDRMVGQHQLHPNVAIIACGNLDTDNAITYPLSSALISRFAHFYVEANSDDWREWASGAGIDSRITSFIGFRPQLLYTFNPDSTEPYASPRTWEMLSKVIAPLNDLGQWQTPLLASLVGQGVAIEFLQFLELYQELPSLDDILANPDTITMPTSMGMQWALLGLLTHHINDENLVPVQTFLQRLPQDLQVVALKEICARHKTLMPKLRTWITQLGSDLFN